MTSVISSYLDDVKAREDSATKGPWKFKRSKGEGFASYGMVDGYQRSVQQRDLIRDFDAEFIAHSREDVYILRSCLGDCIELIEKKKLGESDIRDLLGRLNKRIQQSE